MGNVTTSVLVADETGALVRRPVVQAETVPERTARENMQAATVAAGTARRGTAAANRLSADPTLYAIIEWIATHEGLSVASVLAEIQALADARGRA